MKDVDVQFESTRYSALDASSDLSFTFCRPPSRPLSLWYRVPHFPPVAFTRSTSKSRMCVHSYSSCSVVEFTASLSTSHFLEPGEVCKQIRRIRGWPKYFSSCASSRLSDACIMQGIGRKGELDNRRWIELCGSGNEGKTDVRVD